MLSTLPYAACDAKIVPMIERLTAFYAFHVDMFLTIHRRAGIPRHSDAPSKRSRKAGVKGI